MIAAIHLTTLYEWGGVTILIGFLGRLAWGLFKALRHVTHVHEAIIGRPASPGVEAIPSMIQRFEAVDDQFSAVNQHLGQQDKRIDRIDSELRPNGGASLVDKVDRIERLSAETSQNATKAATDAAAAVAEVAARAAVAKATADAEAAQTAAQSVTDAAALAAETAAELVLQRIRGDHA